MLCEGLVHRIKEEMHKVRGKWYWYQFMGRTGLETVTFRSTQTRSRRSYRQSHELAYGIRFVPEQNNAVIFKLFVILTLSYHSFSSPLSQFPRSFFSTPLYKSDQPFSSTEIYKTSEHASNRYASVMVSSTLFKTLLPLKLDRTKIKPRPR